MRRLRSRAYRVVRPDGRPLAGAWVLDQPERMAWTDADGRFALAGDTPRWLAVAAADRATTRLYLWPSQTTDLVAGAALGTTVIGRVAGAERSARPVPVLCLVYDATRSTAEGTIGLAIAGDGGFALVGLAPGAARLGADGYGLRGLRDVTLPSEATVELTLPAQQDQTVSGRVLDALDRPQAGVGVSVLARGTGGVLVKTDAEGRYCADCPADPSGSLIASAPGQPAGPAVSLPRVAGGRADLRLPTSWVEGVLSGLPADTTVMVDLVGDEPPAVGGKAGPAEVRTVPPALGDLSWEMRGVVRDGWYHVGSPPGPRNVLLELTYQAGADASPTVAWWDLGTRMLAPGANRLDLALPVARSSLTVRWPEDATRQAVTVVDADTGELLGRAWVRRGNTLTWPALPARDVLVVSHAFGGAARPAPLVTLLPGEQHRVLLQPLPRGGVTLRGHIPHAVAATMVALRREGVYAGTRPAKDNSYLFTNVPPGRYELWCRGPGGWSRQEVRVGPGETVVDLDVP